MKRTIFVLSVLGLTVLPAGAADVALNTEDEKALYALGLAVSESLAQFSLSEAELEIVKAGFTDGSLGRKPRVDLDAFRPKIGELQQQRVAAAKIVREKEGEAFLDKIASGEDVKKKGSGLLIKTIAPGTGKSPGPQDSVKVHYTGTLTDGSVFDSSVERGTPATFRLDRVIACWTEGLQFMKEGGKALLYCPPDIAYGDRGSPPTIPPGSTLVFEVELLEVQK